MNKLLLEYQRKYEDRLLYDPSVLKLIDEDVKVHDQAVSHPLSSAAACLNVLGTMAESPNNLKTFLNSFDLQIDEILLFPSPCQVGGRRYRDKGYCIFEWVGPHESPINEKGGGRGYGRTSVDAFVLGIIDGRITQVLIEWKFTEGISRDISLGRFCGLRGNERLRRYSSVLAELRRNKDFPFLFDEEYKKSKPLSRIGLYDFSPDHLYQILRMTLLAKRTIGLKIGNYVVEDYQLLHLTHSQNDQVNTLQPCHVILSPGLKPYEGKDLHEAWRELLSEYDRARFKNGYWDKSVPMIDNIELRDYLMERYC
ncbi:MAG: hypothetical protein H8D34_31940 [Chloroflexi bacterium]|nr:hypothetical protein [Chloroflexota bacterium]